LRFGQDPLGLECWPGQLASRSEPDEAIDVGWLCGPSFLEHDFDKKVYTISSSAAAFRRLPTLGEAPSTPTVVALDCFVAKEMVINLVPGPLLSFKENFETKKNR
jgi:hypothetical protein